MIQRAAARFPANFLHLPGLRLSPRIGATKSCSLMTSSPVAVSSTCAGEVVPQNGQTSAFLPGFHCASPPQAGQENFFWAVASGINQLHENLGRFLTARVQEILHSSPFPSGP